MLSHVVRMQRDPDRLRQGLAQIPSDEKEFLLAVVRLACRPRTPSSASLVEIVPEDSDEELALDLSSGDEHGDDQGSSNLELLLSDDDDLDLKLELPMPDDVPDICVVDDSPSPQRPVGPRCVARTGGRDTESAVSETATRRT